MIEIGDGRVKVEATDRVSESRVRQTLRDPNDWVTQLAVSEPPQQKTIADADMRGAVQLIDGERGPARSISIQGAFEAWSQLRERHDNGEPVALDVMQSAATMLSELIGRANRSHAQSMFAGVETGIGQAFFA